MQRTTHASISALHASAHSQRHWLQSLTMWTTGNTDTAGQAAYTSVHSCCQAISPDDKEGPLSPKGAVHKELDIGIPAPTLWLVHSPGRRDRQQLCMPSPLVAACGCRLLSSQWRRMQHCHVDKSKPDHAAMTAGSPNQGRCLVWRNQKHGSMVQHCALDQSWIC